MSELNLKTKSATGRGVKSTGVKFDDLSKMWIARILFNGKRLHLGMFRSFEEASQAYKNAKKDKENKSLDFLKEEED